MAEMWVSSGGGKPRQTNTFQEVIERQAARQAGWASHARPGKEGEAIPLQVRRRGREADREPICVSPTSDHFDDLQMRGRPSSDSRSPSQPRAASPFYREQRHQPYPGPSAIFPHRDGQLHSAWSDLLNPAVGPSLQTPSASLSPSSSSAIRPRGNVSAAEMIHAAVGLPAGNDQHEAQPIATQYPWTGDDWGHPDFAPRAQADPIEASPAPGVQVKAKGGLKGWLKSKTGKADKGSKGKERATAATAAAEAEAEERAARKKEAKAQAKREKAERPVFAGGGRGGGQNRKVASVKPATGPASAAGSSGGLAHKSSRMTLPADSTTQSPAPGSVLARSPTSGTYPASYTSAGPLVTFTPDLVEALETLSKPKPKPTFVGGGRGGMQNRKAKEVVLPGRASGTSGGSSHSGGKSGGSGGDGASSRRSIFTSASLDQDRDRDGNTSVHSGGSGDAGTGEKPVFVGGGRGGVQNRRVQDASLAKKKSRMGMGDIRLLAGIGVSSFTTVVSTGTEGSVVLSEGSSGVPVTRVDGMERRMMV